PGQSHVKRISRAHQQMKPREIALPIPEPVADEEDDHHQHDIDREKVRGEGDEKITFGDNHMSAFGRGLEFFYASAERPGPERVSELVSNDINPHWFRQQTI